MNEDTQDPTTRQLLLATGALPSFVLIERCNASADRCPCDSDGVLTVALVDEHLSITHRPTGFAIVSGYHATADGFEAAKRHRDALFDTASFDWAAVGRRGVERHMFTPNLEAVRREILAYIFEQGEP